MKAIIDADQIAFACAASAAKESAEVAISRADTMVNNILSDVEANSYELWLTGKNNFRYKIYPEYKGNRTSTRPAFEKNVREHFMSKWQANLTDTIEADDAVGIRAYESNDFIIVHADKDLNQLEGWHFNWDIWRNGEVIRPKRKYFISAEEAYRNFCYQLVVGDTTDNIKGVVGSGKVAANRLLEESPYNCWFEQIRDLYQNDQELDMNAQCVYIWRKEGDNWKNLVNQMGGLPEDFKGLSSESLEQDTDDGLSNTK